MYLNNFLLFILLMQAAIFDRFKPNQRWSASPKCQLKTVWLSLGYTLYVVEFSLDRLRKIMYPILIRVMFYLPIDKNVFIFIFAQTNSSKIFFLLFLRPGNFFVGRARHWLWGVHGIIFPYTVRALCAGIRPIPGICPRLKQWGEQSVLL